MSDPVSVAEDVGESGRSDAWRFAAFFALTLCALVVLHMVLNRRLPAPQIQADEGGYLGNARYMVSGHGRPTSGYYAGYSLFLVPAALATDAASTFYRAALNINAALSVAAPLLAFVLIRQLFRDTPRWVALITAGIVACSPLVFSFAGLAMSENALVPVVLGIAVLLAHAGVDGRVRFVVFAGALAAFAYWVSPRGLIVAFAALMAFAILAWETRRYLQVLGTGTIVIVVGLVLGQVFETAVKGNAQIGGVTDRKHALLPSLVDPGIWHRWLAGALGRVAYLGAASAGITIIGLAIACSWAVGRQGAIGDPVRRVRRCVGTFAFAAPVVTLVASSAGFAANPTVREIDFWYYGRYTEALAMPALAIGAAWLLSTAARSRVARAAVLAGAATAIAALAVPVLDSGRPDESHFNRLNLLGLLPIHYAFNHPTLTVQLLLGAAIAIALGLLISVKPVIFGLVTVVVMLSAALVVHARYLEPGSVARDRQNGLAEAVRLLKEHGVTAECIGLDRHGPQYSGWNEYNYRFLMASSRFEIVDRDDELKCPLVIASDPTYGSTRAELRLVSVENDAPMSLWLDLAQLTPRARADVTRAGLFFPGSPCDRLPTDAYEASVTAAVSRPEGRPLDLRSVELNLDIGHTGRGAPWLGTRAVATSSGCGRMQVSLTVFDERHEVVFRNSVGIARTIFPGQGIHITTDIATGKGSVPALREGHDYTLSIRLEQIGVRYFGGAKLSKVSLTS